MKTLRSHFIHTIYFPIILSTILLCAFGSVLLIINSRHHIYNSLNNLAQQKSNILEINIEMVEDNIRNIVYNTELQNLLIQYRDRNFSTITEARIQFNQTINNVALFFSSAENIVIYATDGSMVGSKYQVDDQKPAKAQEWFPRISNSRRNTIWLTDLGNTEISQGQRYFVCTVATKILARTTSEKARVGDLLGYLIVRFSFLDLNSLLQTEQSMYSNYLVDDNAVILSSNLSDSVGNYDPVHFKSSSGAVRRINHNGTTYVVIDTKLDNSNVDWHFVSEVPMLQILDDAKIIITFSVLLALLILIATYFIAVRNACSITQVFDQMNSSIGRIEHGDWQAGITMQTNILEIDQSVQQFNHMAVNLERLMYELYEAELRKQQLQAHYNMAQLLNLQMQINPHFLYNTLDTINWLALMHGDNDISEMVLALGKLFRANVNLFSINATIGEELERVKLFMYLEQKRFGDKLSYKIVVEDSLLCCEMPSLMLQPIVENAIKHGIAPYSKSGSITIRIYLEEGLIRVCVQNNGQAIPYEKLGDLHRMWMQILRDPLEADESTDNIGLRNIMKRLSLRYGSDAQFTVASDENGTSFLIGFPFSPTPTSI